LSVFVRFFVLLQQLSRPQFWLATALLQNEIQHVLILTDASVIRPIALVRLTRNPHKQASLVVWVFDLLLRGLAGMLLRQIP
jgi:hypothetical protein